MLSPIRILLIEDNLADVTLVKEAISEGKILVDLAVATDGKQGLEMVRAIHPDLVLLDLDLPLINGHEVLRAIKNDPALRHIPVIILTVSGSDVDVAMTYQQGANSYLTKPIEIQQFVEVISSLEHFWLSLVRLPSRELFEQHAKGVRAAPTRATPVAPLATSESSVESSLIRVLAIDDSEADRHFLGELLAESSSPRFILETSETLREGLNRLNDETFDVVLLDLSLPDSPSKETFDRVMAAHPKIPVVVLTGLDDINVGLLSVRRGAQDYLVKGQITSSLVARVLRYSIERKKVEEERASALVSAIEARVAAEQALWTRDEFISIASHELKTPLTSLILQTDMLVRSFKQGAVSQSSTEKIHRLLSVYERELLRLKGLVLNLLDVGKINAGRLTIEPRRNDLSSVVRDTIAAFEEQLKNAGCEVTVEAPLGLEGDFDRDRVEQVLVNLLSNAMKYASNKPIRVCTGRRDGKIWFEVRDHGQGISKENQTRVFDRFERLAPTIGTSGLGLGLYISRQIVNAHRGTIRVQSELGQGTLFTVELPAVIDEVSRASA